MSPHSNMSSPTYISTILYLFLFSTTIVLSSPPNLNAPPDQSPPRPQTPVIDRHFREAFGNGFMLNVGSALDLSLSKNAVDDRYNDTQCATEFNETIAAVANMEMWAIQSKNLRIFRVHGFLYNCDCNHYMSGN